MFQRSKPCNRLMAALSPMKSPQKAMKSPQKPARPVCNNSCNVKDEGSDALRCNSFHASRFKVCVYSLNTS